MSSAAITRPAWRRSTLAMALLGSFLMWASLPNFVSIWLGWGGPYLGWLGWIAPVPWLTLVRLDKLPGRRPYRALYLAGWAFWLAAIYWLSLPHWLVIPLWIILAAYLAVYLPVFVGLSRVAVHRFSLPLWIAAPVVWTGLELARAHLLTGFLMGSLAHTQVNWTQLIQISDLAGEYGVDFVVVLTAACITSAFRFAEFLYSNNPQSAIRNPQSKLLPRPLALLPSVVVLSAALIYGHLRLSEADKVDAGLHAAGPRIALIQGNSLAEWKFDLERERQIMEQYLAISEDAIARSKSKSDVRAVDLVVWPETMFRIPLFKFDGGYRPPPDAAHSPEEYASQGPRELAALASRLGAPVLVGLDRINYLANDSADRQQRRDYNAAVLVGRDGKIVGTYDKVHRVMFGEYIPFADWLPFLYRISPLTGGIEAGDGPVALRVNGMYCLAPNICYETVLPHVIRRQINTLESRNEYPDALVNVTNDAWYWGTSGLDMHLACGVFRAVETRVPLVIAANGGISAWIDHRGSIRAQSPRMQTDYILADIEPSGMHSLYMRFGDWFAGACLACCIVLTAIGWKSNRELKKTRRQGGKEKRR
jgi:apolipoprotein N-acyltransferase